ncbi:trihelix transcription factor ASIL2-like [Gastrolobium bilobum]|uniref:trihelix transcription factor ASIL2-like n=1 Tax=Gastrolobium bilobum TaxID=150636 RepID=UPI002AAFF9E3|nr:trihelix transcription factor ASIL2-like [Gastrolobium bilobum]
MASPSSPTDSNPPSAVPLPLPAAAPPSTRRLPPPCWTPEETAALIDAYRDKWYSLGRTNLKATHWQEVADAVTARCPNASPAAKTAVQCRHKMEKLRKRYRTEIQRLRSLPVARINSSWVHFKSMDFMEKGPSSVKPDHDNNHESLDLEDDDEDDLYERLKLKNGSGSNTRSINKLYRNGIAGSGAGAGAGFRIRIPTGVSVAQHGSKLFGKVGDQKLNNPTNSNGGVGVGVGGGPTRVVKERSGLGKRERERERERERDPVGEMVSAIKVLRDGFVRMEQMKMEMAREIETMRMEMEMKRTEMILESQQRIVEAFANAVSEKRKKGKTIPSPSES